MTSPSMNCAKPDPPPRPVLGSWIPSPEKLRLVGELWNMATCDRRYMNPVRKVCLAITLVTLSRIVYDSLAVKLLVHPPGPQPIEPPPAEVTDQLGAAV